MRIRVASFDIGKKNFSFYIEEFDNFSSNTKNTLVYNHDGTPSPETDKLIKKICKKGKTILHKNLDITKNTKNKNFDFELLYNMNDVLDLYSEYFDDCQYIIIEQQMNFGKGKSNPMAMKLGQHCFSYMTFRYGRFKKVIEYPAYHKTQVLGAPKVNGKGKRMKAMDKPQRKKWNIMKCIELLKLRGDTETLKFIESAKKKDDLSDTFCQLQAFKIQLMCGYEF